MMFSLNMVDYPMSFLLLSTWNLFGWTSRGDHYKMFLLFEFCCRTPPSCLKVGGGWVVAYSILVSAQGPLVLVLVLRGLGSGLDNLGRNVYKDSNRIMFSQIMFFKPLMNLDVWVHCTQTEQCHPRWCWKMLFLPLHKFALLSMTVSISEWSCKPRTVKRGLRNLPGQAFISAYLKIKSAENNSTWLVHRSSLNSSWCKLSSTGGGGQ